MSELYENISFIVLSKSSEGINGCVRTHDLSISKMPARTLILIAAGNLKSIYYKHITPLRSLSRNIHEMSLENITEQSN